MFLGLDFRHTNPYQSVIATFASTKRLIVRFSEELMKHKHENSNRSHRAKSIIYIKGRMPKEFPDNEYDCKNAYNLEKDFHGLGRIMRFLYDEQQHRRAFPLDCRELETNCLNWIRPSDREIWMFACSRGSVKP